MEYIKQLENFFENSSLAFMKTIPFEKVIFDERAKYSCKFGCKNYGRKYSCPPESIALAKKIKKSKYKWILLIATTYSLSSDFSRFKKKTQNYQKEMEIQRISYQLDNLFKINAIDHIQLSGGSCRKCRECSLINNQKCKKPHLKITSMEAVGIDCQKTMHFAGFDLEMPSNNSINRCAAFLLNDDGVSSINLKKIESFQRYKKTYRKSVIKKCNQLREENPKLFKNIELKSLSELKRNNEICDIHCNNYGKNFSCPTYSDKIDLSLWKDYILWSWKENNIKKYSYNNALKKIHSTFFSMGFYFTLSLRDCYCDECQTCSFTLSDKPICNYRKLLSPSMQSQGISPSKFGKEKYGIELI